MKIKALYSLASAVLLTVFFVSCTDEMQEVVSQEQETLKQIVMTTQDFQPEADSRTVYQIADGAVKCTWAENDTVGVFPSEGAQAYFPMASGAGIKNATFDGKGWALKDGYTYASYYPYIGYANLDKNALPISYTGQKQVGNASMSHLGDYDYMVATPTAPEFGSAQFMFKHLSALVQLKITVPQPVTFTSVKLVTDTEAFAVEGKVDIMADAPAITPVTSSTEVVLNLQDVATTEENEVVTFYFMLPPADLSGQTLKAVLACDKGIQEITLESKHLKAGTAYALSGELRSSYLGYKDGVVRLGIAGTIAQLLGEDFLKITSLKVEGPINGDDVRCLRQMLGGSEFIDAKKGNLTSLDLSEATIVKGGGKYLDYYGICYTDKDTIGNYMFSNCKNLQEIVLPTSVISIGISAFEDCSSLYDVTIGAGVISIGDCAFRNCDSLISLDIPDNVTSIGISAFEDCSSLYYVTIGAGINLISSCAFKNCDSLFSIDIPAGVTSIDVSAFYGCSYLNNVTIGENVTSIGSSAFYGCSYLTSVTIGVSVTSIGSSAFYGCSSLTAIDIPASVTSIGISAFEDCKSLTSVTMGVGVTSIGSYAFYNCTSMEYVYITDLSAWCKITFSNLSSNPVGQTNAKLYLHNQELTELVIPADIKRIKDYAFYGCKSIKKITLGEGVTSIGNKSFYCYFLTNVYCHRTTPPAIIPNSSFYESSDNMTLYVPKECSQKYQKSAWASFFGTIKEME